MAAARYGQRGVFDFLVSKGCDEEMIDDSGNNILHVACLGGDLKLVKSILVKETVGINSRGHCGRTPMMAAARMGHKHVLKTLLNSQCDASLVDDDNNNILHYACIGGHLDVVQYILKRTIIDINSKGKHGMTPVMISVEIDHRHMFNLLVHKGAELSHVDDNENNILHLTCSSGNVKMVTDLLAKDSVDINSRGQNGGTALMWATWWHQSDVIDLLLSKGADASLTDNDGNNILHNACIGGHLEVVQYILKKNIVDINCKGKHGMTPVMISLDVRHMLVFDFLVRREADLSHVDDNGNNILHLACLWGCKVIAKYILSKHIVDIDSKGQSSRTPVMMAAVSGHKEVFSLLVSEGANLSSIDASGNNILHLGCLGGSESIVQHILSHNVVDINAMNHDGSKATNIATEQGHSSICELLGPQPTN
ncbi:putative ankyrin repeat protein RF_0381 [Haliotis rufescens]|uniref:putative ankyrin repeat protein RF_0381 n=1 Tax=Haliotis rufescens TaxID=6454 RepID=UPI00201EE86B|nr:putative ankyrin repeat protein RF_0381 [Haliotis rufescens]